MRTSSIITILASALAGCYDDPQLAIHVARDDRSENLEVRACDPSSTTCAPDVALDANVFASGPELTREVWLYLDADVDVRLTISSDATYVFCVPIALAAGTQHRDVHVHVGGTDPWTCPAGVATCEVAVPLAKDTDPCP